MVTGACTKGTFRGRGDSRRYQELGQGAECSKRWGAHEGAAAAALPAPGPGTLCL